MATSKKSVVRHQRVECKTCDDTGRVPAMGQVYPGEPHMADVDEMPCPDCGIDDSDHHDPDDY